MMLLQIVDPLISSETTGAIKEVFYRLGLRLAIDVTAIFVLVRYIYYHIYKQREYFFTFFIFNLIIFFMCFFLNRVELSMGAAFGLFAVFSMLRYRTEDISIKDMTYLFLVIAIGLISAVIPDPMESIRFKLEQMGYKQKDIAKMLSYGSASGEQNQHYFYEFLFISAVNAFILLITWLLESNLLVRRELAKTIMYENIELIKADREKELIDDLRLRTGLDVRRYNILKIDFLRDMATIKIYYHEKNNGKPHPVEKTG
jgi:hypothetical protein